MKSVMWFIIALGIMTVIMTPVENVPQVKPVVPNRIVVEPPACPNCDTPGCQGCEPKAPPVTPSEPDCNPRRG